MITGLIYLIISLTVFFWLFSRDKSKAQKALMASWEIAKNIGPLLLAVFGLIGLFKVFILPTLIANFLAKLSLFPGIILADIVGSFSAGHPSASYVVGGYLKEIGLAYAVIAAFILSWVLVNTISLPVEINIFGRRFALWRNFLSFILVIIIALIVKVVL